MCEAKEALGDLYQESRNTGAQCASIGDPYQESRNMGTQRASIRGSLPGDQKRGSSACLNRGISTRRAETRELSVPHSGDLYQESPIRVHRVKRLISCRKWTSSSGKTSRALEGRADIYPSFSGWCTRAALRNSLVSQRESTGLPAQPAAGYNNRSSLYRGWSAINMQAWRWCTAKASSISYHCSLVLVHQDTVR